MSLTSHTKRSLAVGAAAVVCASVAWWVWLSSDGDATRVVPSGATVERTNAGGLDANADEGDRAAQGDGRGSRVGTLNGHGALVGQSQDGHSDRMEPGPADSQLNGYLEAASQALRADEPRRAGVAQTATGAALDAARASAAEFEDNDWHQTGSAQIVSSSVVLYHPDAAPPRMRIVACVDSSDVDVVDDSGASVRHGSYTPRSRMLFDLVRQHGDWLVERQTFPDDPDC